MSDAGRLPRFFIPPTAEPPETPFRQGRHAALPPTEAHHAAHVLRLNVGDAVELFDGRGASAAARIVRVGRGRVAAVIEAVREPASRPRPLIHLAVAVPKGRRLTWLLEKATELGAASVAPVRFERSVAGTGGVSSRARGRWLGRCIAAAKQARVAFLPTLSAPRPLEEFLASPRAGIYGDVSDAAVPLARALAGCARAPSIYIVVGPEGGLTGAERRALDAAGLAPARLGRTTLRIETAAIALLSAAIALRDR